MRNKLGSHFELERFPGSGLYLRLPSWGFWLERTVHRPLGGLFEVVPQRDDPQCRHILAGGFRLICDRLPRAAPAGAM